MQGGVLRGAAHRNLKDIAVRCTLFLSFNSHSTNIRVRCTYSHKVICFEVRFKDRGDLVKKGEQGKTNLITLLKMKIMPPYIISMMARLTNSKLVNYVIYTKM